VHVKIVDWQNEPNQPIEGKPAILIFIRDNSGPRIRDNSTSEERSRIGLDNLNSYYDPPSVSSTYRDERPTPLSRFA
jgi:hypothetical protein